MRPDLYVCPLPASPMACAAKTAAWCVRLPFASCRACPRCAASRSACRAAREPRSTLRSASSASVAREAAAGAGARSSSSAGRRRAERAEQERVSRLPAGCLEGGAEGRVLTTPRTLGCQPRREQRRTQGGGSRGAARQERDELAARGETRRAKRGRRARHAAASPRLPPAATTSAHSHPTVPASRPCRCAGAPRSRPATLAPTRTHLQLPRGSPRTAAAPPSRARRAPRAHTLSTHTHTHARGEERQGRLARRARAGKGCASFWLLVCLLHQSARWPATRERRELAPARKKGVDPGFEGSGRLAPPRDPARARA